MLRKIEGKSNSKLDWAKWILYGGFFKGNRLYSKYPLKLAIMQPSAVAENNVCVAFPHGQ